MSPPFSRHWSASIVLGAILGGILLRAQQPRTDAQDKPTFTVQVDLVTADAIVRDAKGQFVPDLTKDDFELYEDSVRQDLATMTLVHGGRVTNVLALPPRPQVEGLLLPTSRPATDISGRVFLFFVDDLHMNVHNTAQVRDLFKQVEKTL